MATAFGICAAVFLGAAPAWGDESPFALIYTTETLPAGGKEIEQWATWGHGRPYESWDQLAGRTEIEYGITDALQVSLYANYDWTRARPNSALALDDAYDRGEFTSASSEVIYRVTDPYTHPVGLALYLEPAYGANSREIEAKLLLESHFLDDRLVLAANPVMDWEWQRTTGNVPLAHGTELLLLTGLSYNFMPGWYGGIEFEAKREGDGLLFGDAFHQAADSFRIGPTLHYGHENWWVTAGALAQLPWAANLNGEAGQTVQGFAHEVPRFSLTIRFGIEI